MLCACRTGSLWLRLLVVTLAILLTLAGWAGGKEPWTKPLRAEPQPGPSRVDVPGWVDRQSDAAQARRALQKGAILVAYGTELNPAEFQELEEMLTTRACRASESLLRDELMTLRGSMELALRRHLDTEKDWVMEDLSEDHLLAALRTSLLTGKPASLRIGDFTAEIGFARYRQWKTHWLLIPVEGTEREDPFQIRLEERRLTLPATRQAYIRLLLKGELLGG